MNVIKRSLLLLNCIFTFAAMAQKPLEIDAHTLIKRITTLPPTVEEFHSLFTANTRFGEEFRMAELTDPPYLQFKQLVSTLHDRTIRAIMKKTPRTDMPDSVQYEDERWKLALRPLLTPVIKDRIAKLNVTVKPTVLQIFNMQTIFDWLDYYKEDEKIKKIYRQKITALSGESATAKAKVHQEELLYQTQQQIWTNRYNKYTKALMELQQLMEKINYGTGLQGEEKEITELILHDVQTRALEAHEKLIWNEMQIAINAELTFNAKRIANMFAE